MLQSAAYATLPCGSWRGHAFAFHEKGQALGALLFLYRDVLELDLPWLDGVVRAKRPERLPVVLTREEVAAVLRQGRQGPRHHAPGLKADLARHLEAVRTQHQRDLHRGAGWVELPTALGRKYPNAGREWVWQWAFPATRPYRDRETGQWRRHHLHESVVQRVVKDAARRTGIAKRATPPHAPPLVCDASARRRPRHPHRAGAAWPS